MTAVVEYMPRHGSVAPTAKPFRVDCSVCEDGYSRHATRVEAEAAATAHRCKRGEA